jgi:carbamate kinase
MKVLVALGGNAILQRGQEMSVVNQQANIRRAAQQLARVAMAHELVLTHGNGPQVGLLALQAAAYRAVQAYPLDVLGAESQGMVGYLLEQELANLLPASRTVTTLLTRVEVAADDPAFAHPTKPIGPVYTQPEAERLAKEESWHIAADGDHFRRVVPSPRPLQVLNLAAIRCLIDGGVLVIAAGGGGIPVARTPDGPGLVGVEAVIDKDLCAGLLAHELGVDCLVIATDVANVFLDWGQPTQRAVGRTTPAELAQHDFAAGSMGPKVQTACEFATATGHRAVIGSLDAIEAMLAGTAGTQVAP